MVKRRGIGASAASAVIFSVLLISNLAVYLASQDRSRSYSQSDAEDSLNDGAIASVGAAGANILIGAQAAIGSTTLECQGAAGTVAGEIARLTDVQHVGNLTVSASAQMSAGAQAVDNISMLAPFNGSVAGDLNVVLLVAASGGDSPAGVSFIKNEVHFVHLPVHLGGAASDCLHAVQDITAALTAVVPANCTMAAINPLVSSAAQASASAAAADGFGLGFTYAITETTQCSISFAVAIEQTGIRGPLGEFGLLMREEGFASFSQPQSPPRA